MLYLFKAPFVLCQAAEKTCSTCTKCINDTCTSSCNSIAQCIEETLGGICGSISCVFKAIGSCLGGIVYCFVSSIQGIIRFFCSFVRCDQPLGFFVIYACAFNIPLAYYSYLSYTKDEDKLGPKMLCGAGLVNIFIAVYLKLKVNYQKRPSFDPLETDLAPEEMVKRQDSLSTQEIMTRLNYIVKYDCTFCLYFFFAAFVWFYAIFDAVSGRENDLTPNALEIIYAPFCSCYLCCLYCCTGVASGADVVANAVAGSKKQKQGNQPVDARQHLLPK